MEVLQIWVKNMESKKDIRKCVLEKRNLITAEEWEEKSCLIFEKVVTHPFFLNADAIYCYIDYRNEVGTKDIIRQAWNLGKKVAVPKILNGKMSFYYIKSFGDVMSGYCGILEPQITELADENTDENVLVIIPGVAFDKGKYRIGYGKGFYDRYLTAHPRHHTLSLAFELQIVEHIPGDVHDICPELIITEEHIYV